MNSTIPSIPIGLQEVLHASESARIYERQDCHLEPVGRAELRFIAVETTDKGRVGMPR